ncbi:MULTISPECIES: META domain-containing protein [Methylobacterium]|jgi:heat shock protein HslJ|nr:MULTISPECIES: META domain-containing protein [Methylobacterium]MBY0296456.1 META domain-containing protein [Methylobacterium sp.]MDN3627254.1 META domain-containing protein [Methylobacterium isbiliense]
MMVKRMATAVGAVALVACATQASAQAFLGYGQKNRDKPDQKQYVPAAKAQEKIFPLDSTWTAVSLNGKAFSGSDRPSFIIDKQYRARGFGGCNTFAATAFPLKEQHLAVGPLALTKKSCEKGVSAAEMQFLTAFRTSGQWDIVGSQLVIKSQAGELRFDRAL